jgi:hypothetical protein
VVLGVDRDDPACRLAALAAAYGVPAGTAG